MHRSHQGQCGATLASRTARDAIGAQVHRVFHDEDTDGTTAQES